jgi:three-Cys-motif partner protein
MNNSRQGFGGDWTVDKLERVGKYLEAYQIALKNKAFYRIYIDAFAGTGYNRPKKHKDSQELSFPEFEEEKAKTFFDGSARIALKVEPPFHLYTFIEKNPKRFAELEKLKVDFPSRNIVLEKAEANVYLKNLCQQSWDNRRAVLFLDPFGMQVTWDTIEAIARTEAIDLWLLFPLMAVNRLLKTDGNIPDSWRKRLDYMFGDSAWYDEFYKPKTQPSFLEMETGRQKTANFEAIEEYFVRRLKTAFSAVADNPLRLTTPTGNPLFLLCFAVSNSSPRAIVLAMRIARHILGKKR